MLWLAPAVSAALDTACDDLDRPDDYSDVRQQDFMMNHAALATTFSAIHGPVPHRAGGGALGVELAAIPPLDCYRRAAFDYQETVDANKSPLLPRLRGRFVFETPRVAPYVGVGFTPPIPVGGAAGYLFSGEAGIGIPLGAPSGDTHGRSQLGVRVHGSLLRTVGALAGALEDGAPEIDDLYVGSSLGADVQLGYRFDLGTGSAVPYASLGWTDVSSVFVVGEDGTIVSNLHPYFGPVGALGFDLRTRRVRLGAELFAAPGGASRPRGAPEDLPSSPEGFGAFGHLYTVRLFAGAEFPDRAAARRREGGS